MKYFCRISYSYNRNFTYLKEFWINLKESNEIFVRKQLLSKIEVLSNHRRGRHLKKGNFYDLNQFQAYKITILAIFMKKIVKNSQNWRF